MSDSGACLAAARKGDRLTLRMAEEIDGRDVQTVRVTGAAALSGHYYDRVEVTAEPVGDSEACRAEIQTRYIATGWREPEIAVHYPDGSTSSEVVVVEATRNRGVET